MAHIALISGGAEGLGPQYISASLKQAGHEVSFIYDPMLFDDKVFINHPRLAKWCGCENKILKEVACLHPDLIGFTVVTDIFQWSIRLATRLKQKINVPIIAGGTHPTIAPGKVLEHDCFDMACVGEGEQPIVDLANSFSNGNYRYDIPNIWVKRNGEIIRNPLRPLLENLDLLPVPDRSIYIPHMNNESLITMSARGCLFRCSYCFNNAVSKRYRGLGTYLRRKSPQAFVDEIATLVSQYGFKFVKIYDDIFTYDSNWLKDFATLYPKKVGLPYFCLGHPKYLQEEQISILKASGCAWVQVGVETFNANIRKSVCERYDSNEQILQMFEFFDKYRLAFEPDHILGLPGESLTDHIEAVKTYACYSSLLKVNTNILSYIPDTKMIEHGIKENDITAGDVESINSGREGCRVASGSIRDRQRIRTIKDFVVFLKALPIIPRWGVGVIIKLKLYKLLHLLEPWLGYLVRLSVMDKVDRLYLKQFLFQLYKRIRQ